MHADGSVRIETIDPDNKANGTVRSKGNVLEAGEWTHLAATVRRGDNETKLYVNGFQVATGTIQPGNLDNSITNLCLGRIENSLAFFEGEIAEVYCFRRSIEVAEIQALVEPGRRFAVKPNATVSSVLRFGMPSNAPPRGLFPQGEFGLENNDVVVVTGQTDAVRAQKEGTLEALLATHFALIKPRFRNIAWEGDTVYQQTRPENLGTWEG